MLVSPPPPPPEIIPKRELVRAKSGGLCHTTSSKVWDAVGDAISKGEHLKKIRICNMHFIADYSYRLFQKVRTYNCPIVELILDRNTDFYCGSYLVPFIKSITPTLKILSINNSSIHDETMVSISEALNQSNVLEKLFLQGNNIEGYGLEGLLLGGSIRHIVELNIDGNKLKKRGLNFIMEFLKRTDTKIKLFGFDCKDIDYAAKLVAAIPRESNVERLTGTIGTRSNTSSLHIAPVLQNVVCGDVSSLSSICQSNHKLQNCGHNTGYMLVEPCVRVSPHLGDCLEINTHGLSYVKKLRTKLRAFYFKGEFDINPFLNMDVVMMPYVLEMVTKTEFCIERTKGGLVGSTNKWQEDTVKWYEVQGKTNLDSIYRLVRNCHMPETFGFQSPELKLRSVEAKNAQLQTDNVILKQKHGEVVSENALLQAEIANLRAQLSGLPSKRAKRE